MEQLVNSTTILGPDVTVAGETLRFPGSLHVYGSVVGDVEVGSTLLIGEGGAIDGDVQAAVAQVSGRLKGSVECDRFELRRSGSVDGAVRAERWSMEQGAVIEAEFVHEHHDEFARRVPAIEEEYFNALRAASALTGKEYAPSEGYTEWSSRLKASVGNASAGSKKRKRFADQETAGRLGWSKSVGDESGKRVWPASRGEAGDLFDGKEPK
jgi:cytoskeletal protein CcmA (bactofilin family)